MRADGRYTYFNRRWFDYCGLSREESLDRGWSGLVHPDDGPAGRRTLGAGVQEWRDLRGRIPSAPGRWRLPLDAGPGRCAT
ncbi:PAS domain-containing protein [Polaromonas sp. P1(28)-8]|nr:PAS domain-containing protein [Polaromonas sp. P1(28)-8]